MGAAAGRRQVLQEDLVARGVSPSRRRLFVIDASKVLQQAFESEFSAQSPAVRYRNHKLRNIDGLLPSHWRRRVILPTGTLNDYRTLP